MAWRGYTRTTVTSHCATALASSHHPIKLEVPHIQASAKADHTQIIVLPTFLKVHVRAIRTCSVSTVSPLAKLHGTSKQASKHTQSGRMRVQWRRIYDL
jgi:hypothetical protein